jgi:hypothetical protein
MVQKGTRKRVTCARREGESERKEKVEVKAKVKGRESKHQEGASREEEQRL